MYLNNTYTQNPYKIINDPAGIIAIESLLQISFLATLLFFVHRASYSHGGFVSPSHHGFTTLRVGALVVDVPAGNYRRLTLLSLTGCRPAPGDLRGN